MAVLTEDGSKFRAIVSQAAVVKQIKHHVCVITNYLKIAPLFFLKCSSEVLFTFMFLFLLYISLKWVRQIKHNVWLWSN